MSNRDAIYVCGLIVLAIGLCLGLDYRWGCMNGYEPILSFLSCS